MFPATWMVASRSQRKFRGKSLSPCYCGHESLSRAEGRQVLAVSHRRVDWHLRHSSYLPEEMVPF